MRGEYYELKILSKIKNTLFSSHNNVEDNVFVFTSA